MASCCRVIWAAECRAVEIAAAGPGDDATPREPLALPAPSVLEDYMGDPDRFAYRDEMELAAREQEMRRKATAAVGR